MELIHPFSYQPCADMPYISVLACVLFHSAVDRDHSRYRLEDQVEPAQPDEGVDSLGSRRELPEYLRYQVILENPYH